MLTQKINVPFASNPPYERLKMHFGDSGRVVEITMLFEGQPYAPPTGAVATFQAKKPDGTVVTRTDGVSISGSTVTVEITSNTLAQIGIVYCECLIFADGHTIGTMRFEIEVMEPAVRPGDIESSDDYQSIAEVLANAEAAIEQFQEDGQGAIQSFNQDGSSSITDFEEEAQAVLDSYTEHYRGAYPTMEILAEQVPVGNAGDYALIGEEGTDAGFAIWDPSDNKWVFQAGGLDPITIKTLYESNPDTNVYTDAEKAKLASATATPASGSTNLFTAGGAYNLAPKASPTLTGTPAAPTPATGNNSTQIATTAFVKAALLAMWPVGSIYMSIASANPSTFIGGTWARTAQGRVMIGVEETNGEINGPSKLLGDYNVPIRTYNLPAQSVTYNPNNFNWGAALYSPGSNGYSALAHANPPIASEQPIRVIQPSMTCYIWQRTA